MSESVALNFEQILKNKFVDIGMNTRTYKKVEGRLRKKTRTYGMYSGMNSSYEDYLKIKNS